MTTKEDRTEIRRKRSELYEREPADWTDDEIVTELTGRYEPSVIPPCRVCGGELSMVSSGGGPTKWACTGREEDPDRPGYVRWMTGRTPADDHYEKSERYDNKCGGDDVVMELITRFRKLRK